MHQTCVYMTDAPSTQGSMGPNVAARCALALEEDCLSQAWLVLATVVYAMQPRACVCNANLVNTVAYKSNKLFIPVGFVNSC